MAHHILFDTPRPMMYNAMYIGTGGTGMANMIRKQVYIEPRQDVILKQLAHVLGLSEAEIIRRAIDRQMVAARSGIRDLEAWEREKAFIAERMTGGPAPCRRQWRREDAYEERLARYGR
jgi:hypothetical protein